jgi:peptidoglycan/xylan/chitin deacetylase (PgdA/CDA1 family)
MTRDINYNVRRITRKTAARLGAAFCSGTNLPRILMYHRVASTASRLAVSKAMLERHLDVLEEEEIEVLTVTDLVERSVKEPNLRAVALSFDDGYHEIHSIVAPMLAKRGWGATFYVITSHLCKGESVTGEGNEFLNIKQVRELAAAGFEIGAHTHTHPTLTHESDDVALAEIRNSRDVLSRILGRPPRSFAYPRGCFRQSHLLMVDSMRFHNAVTVRPGRVERQSPYLALPRTEMAGGDDEETFRYKLAGGIDFVHQLKQAAMRG